MDLLSDLLYGNVCGANSTNVQEFMSLFMFATGADVFLIRYSIAIMDYHTHFVYFTILRIS